MEYLKGKVSAVHDDYILVEGENRIGYKFFRLSEDEYILNQNYTIFVHECISLDNNSIAVNRFGFLNDQVKRLFEFLIEQKGIGPKVAKGLIFSFGNSKKFIDCLSGVELEKIHRLGKKYANTLIQAVNRPKNKRLLHELSQSIHHKSIRSEVMWILLNMEYERDRCTDIIDSVNRDLVNGGNDRGIEGLKIEEAVRECLARLFVQ